MRYSKVFIESFGYELAPNVVTSDDLEKKLAPFFKEMGFEQGQLVALTGIKERRYWDKDHTLAEHAAVAGQRALDEADISPDQIGALVYCGVGQDGFEPATSCSVAHRLHLGKDAHIYDVKSACLGMITGIVTVANEIELGNINAGLVVSCETARQIVDSTIDEIIAHSSLEFYKDAIATMTGGSGAAAVLLTNGTIGNPDNRKHALKGGVVKNAIEHHGLCHWGFEQKGMPTDSKVIMRTQAQGVLEHGLDLARKTFNAFKKEFNLPQGKPDKFIGHQVGALHHQKFYRALNEDIKKDFCTFPFLGNIGTVSLPISAAIADERGFLNPGDFVAFIGVGSGLNCYILGVEW
ncbi:MAG: 3-oxoacyl-ACP synthase III [Proteobacteria bacterium]|nr:3-oxoacyl-ACP synthase III [Pseudomonadota bacterium]MBU1586093.1 3-oxoacyl-ACP synthase III [Pseudomonadota bacterium]MBU2452728.1 3-oxoacyl-ACP synthase III [Pseudomonadota bacterium]MBU2628124.1 3-oxoacyl-ACP synthase III [Pseudomonadota bacterium]